MTIPRFGRLVGSMLAASLVALIGCAGANPPPNMSGAGGDTISITPTPLCGPTANNGMAGGVGTMPVPPGASFSQFPPQLGATTTASVAPPAISGGTLLVLPDGHTAVASDPDRDLVYLVDLTSKSVTATITLNPDDEPGRVVIDGASRAHVALRHGGALVSIDTVTGALLQRRDVCAAPRGVAYDSAADLLHVACAGGELISLPAAGGSAVRSLTLSGDLRDVVVDGPRLRVSRFRSAELLTVEADGTVSGRVTPPNFRWAAARQGQNFTPGAAWRTMAMPDGSGVMMLHQRGVSDQEPVQPVPGGYGGPDTCGSIVHPGVTVIGSDGSTRTGPALAGLVLAVDMAIAPDGHKVAFVSAGNATNILLGVPSGLPGVARVFVSDVDSTTDDQVGCMPDGTHAPCSPGLIGGVAMPVPSGAAGSSGAVGCGGVPDPQVPQNVGQPIAVAFDGAGQVVVQSREPARLYLADGTSVSLSNVSRADTGHLIFHSNAGGFLACGSCHLEGNDDGRIWNFTCQGPRRTQSLHSGGLRDTAPFHWDGQETDMTRLMNDVFVGRMSGPLLGSDQIDVLLSWVDNQPRVPRAAPADAAAVERGRQLFSDTSRGLACASCHAGAHFTNNASVDVGTGAPFQVPSLIGVGTRGPFMHNGCAKTLADRFDPACGGAQHGSTTGNGGLTDGQIADLIAYMQSI